MNLHDTLTADVPPELLDALAGIAGNEGMAGYCKPEACTPHQVTGQKHSNCLTQGDLKI